MRIARAIRQVADNARAFGPQAALIDLEHRAVNKVVPFQILRGMTAEVADVDPKMFDAGAFETRFVTRDELLAASLDDEVREEMSPAFIEAALEKGDECYGIFDGDCLASFGWYASQPTELSPTLVLHFDPRWRYMYKGYTRSSHRGMRLHGIGMSLALREYAARGSNGLISYVASNNFRSLRSTERMGYRVFGDVYVARCFGRDLSWSSPGCARYGFRVETVETVEPVA